MVTPVYITASSHTSFAIQQDESLYSLFAQAINDALKNFQGEVKDIDAVFVANYSGGSFNQQEHLAPFAVNINPALRFKPMFRVEGACASGASAIHLAKMAIQSREINTVLVVGVEKMSDQDTAGVTKSLAKASYYPIEGNQGFTFPALFAEFANGWMNKFGYSRENLQRWLALITEKAYSFGAENELAQLRKRRSAEQILSIEDKKNPLIADPLRLHDCSPISDGAAAVILSRHRIGNRLVELKAIETSCDYLNIIQSDKPNYFFEAAQASINRVLTNHQLKINDIQFAEVHDCFTIAEFLMYSALGLTKNGYEFEAIESGVVSAGGKCVVNPSGGLKSKGHPVGATGVSMHALAYRQLCEQATGFQVKNAENALVVNLGGSAATNVVSLLSRAV